MAQGRMTVPYDPQHLVVLKIANMACLKIGTRLSVTTITMAAFGDKTRLAVPWQFGSSQDWAGAVLFSLLLLLHSNKKVPC